jgi:hypothetical protein
MRPMRAVSPHASPRPHRPTVRAPHRPAASCPPPPHIVPPPPAPLLRTSRSRPPQTACVLSLPSSPSPSPSPCDDWVGYRRPTQGAENFADICAGEERPPDQVFPPLVPYSNLKLFGYLMPTNFELTAHNQNLISNKQALGRRAGRWMTMAGGGGLNRSSSRGQLPPQELLDDLCRYFPKP